MDVKKKDDAEGKGEDALDEVASVAASAASAASVGQRRSGGYLALKLQALLQGCPSSKDSLPTPELHLFDDPMLGKGTYGMVCEA